LNRLLLSSYFTLSHLHYVLPLVFAKVHDDFKTYTYLQRVIQEEWEALIVLNFSNQTLACLNVPCNLENNIPHSSQITLGPTKTQIRKIEQKLNRNAIKDSVL